MYKEMNLDIVPQKDYFSTESQCRCGVCSQKPLAEREDMDPYAKYKMNQIREILGVPLSMSSGKRCENHPIEREKFNKKGRYTGQHWLGTAADILCTGNLRYSVLKVAILLGATGIAFGKNFIHVDFRNSQPMTWTY